MTFRRIERGNNWGAAFYAYAGERLDEYGTNDTQNALILHPGSRLRVRWPDGTETTEELVPHKVSGSYSDMGSQHEYTTQIFGVDVQIRGVNAWVPIEALELDDAELQRRKDSVDIAALAASTALGKGNAGD